MRFTVTLMAVADNSDALLERMAAWTMGEGEGVMSIHPEAVTVPPDLQAAPPPPPPPPAPLVAAGFTYTPEAPGKGDTVQFDGSHSTGTVVRYDWDFGDGSGTAPDGGPTPTYAYNKTGDYTVTLVVTDDNGDTSQATGPVTVG